MKKLWIVGKWKENKPWEFAGVFDSKKKAVDACTEELYFVGPAELNYRLPDETIAWVGCYYPLLEPESRLKA